MTNPEGSKKTAKKAPPVAKLQVIMSEVAASLHTVVALMGEDSDIDLTRLRAVIVENVLKLRAESLSEESGTK